MTEKIISQLFKLQEEKYKSFTSALIPTVDKNKIIGVRIPLLRSLAKKFIRSEDVSFFLSDLPHRYHEENLFHALLINENKNFESCISQLNSFLPHVDNWAVCDSIRPKVFSKNKKALLSEIEKWLRSDSTYTVRFAAEMLMLHFLDEDFEENYLEAVSKIQSEEYYINMMIAWYFATALAKQWKFAIVYLEEKRLDPSVHNKTIQKATESYRITDEQKQYLKTLRI
ncbi:MAG: DNA alkylation repair protein [Clostridia bacterium]|nr:DNA alkylation repair protein [Clostridia bacterium]